MCIFADKCISVFYGKGFIYLCDVDRQKDWHCMFAFVACVLKMAYTFKEYRIYYSGI